MVVVLYGAKVPSVLRPARQEGEYYFVGECYVHGAMYGEAFASASVAAEEEIPPLV